MRLSAGQTTYGIAESVEHSLAMHGCFAVLHFSADGRIPVCRSPLDVLLAREGFSQDLCMPSRHRENEWEPDAISEICNVINS